MRKRYAATFRLGSHGELPPTLDQVIVEVAKWLDRPMVTLPIELESSLVSTTDRTRIGPGYHLETRVHVSGDHTQWALRFTHPDRDDSSVVWRVDLAYNQEGEGALPWFSCTMFLGTKAGTVVPIRRGSSRPRIVSEIIRRWGAWNGLPLSTEAQVVSKDDAHAFVQLLESEERRVPVVFLSATNTLDRPIISPGKVASALAGVAHVVTAKDRFTTLYGLEKLMPSHLMATDGEVRIYWPRFSRKDSWYQHRRWSPREVQENREFQFRLLAVVSGVTVGTDHPRAPSWERVNRAHREQLIADARHSGDKDELLELLESDSSDQQHQIEELQFRVAELEDDLATTSAQRDSYKQVCLHKVAESEDAELPGGLPIESMADALEWAQANFSEELLFCLNSKSEGSNSTYENPLEVYKALEFLATTYRDAKLGIKACPSFDIPFRDACGWRWMGHQNELTMKQNSDWYYARYQGRRVPLDFHVGTGSSKDPRHTIRIGFHWFDDEEKVIVGYVGQHQRTSAT